MVFALPVDSTKRRIRGNFAASTGAKGGGREWGRQQKKGESARAVGRGKTKKGKGKEFLIGLKLIK